MAELVPPGINREWYTTYHLTQHPYECVAMQQAADEFSGITVEVITRANEQDRFVGAMMFAAANKPRSDFYAPDQADMVPALETLEKTRRALNKKETAQVVCITAAVDLTRETPVTLWPFYERVLELQNIERQRRLQEQFAKPVRFLMRLSGLHKHD